MQSKVKVEPRTDFSRDPEDSAFAPTPQELERLLFAVESSLQINKRFQFFLWAQGVLQNFIAHSTMLCLVGNLDSRSYRTDMFSTDSVANSDAPLDPSIQHFVELALEDWISNGRRPLLLSAEAQKLRASEPLIQSLWELGLGNVLVHGSGELRGANATLFIFGRLERAPRRRASDIAEILMPYLHFAMYRSQLSEREDAANRPNGQPALSLREVQIMMGVRDGKTNSEIGLLLDISPLTVKNHIQRILRKLGVGNRTQAVTRCLSMGVFENISTSSSGA
jgi:transcriptional regulator EpsA